HNPIAGICARLAINSPYRISKFLVCANLLRWKLPFDFQLPIYQITHLPTALGPQFYLPIIRCSNIIEESSNPASSARTQTFVAFCSVAITMPCSYSSQIINYQLWPLPIPIYP